jgi:3-keto-5-aminohexanoate cleavage enzyme
MTDLVVNLAPTGMIPTKEMTPHVPVTPAEIVADVLRCHREHGITSVHLHARDDDGRPTYRKEVYAEIIAGLREAAPDLVLCASTSGRDFPEFAQRSEVLDLDGDLRPDMASLTLSSLNFPRQASLNAPAMVADLARKMRDHGIKPELEAFDAGMINVIGYLLEREILEPPLYCNVFVGNLATAQMTLIQLGALITALPAGATWSVAGIGDAQLEANAIGVAHGGGVRVGVEDNIWFDRDRSVQASNPDLLGRVAALAELHQRRIMRPSELARRLELTPRPGLG